MSCRKVWPRSFLASNFTQKFMNKTYKQHRENVLLEREKALMPETQNFVELEIKIRKLTTRLIQTGQSLQRSRRELFRIKAMSLNELEIDDEFLAGEKRILMQIEPRHKCSVLKAELEQVDEHIKFLSLYRYGHRDATRFKRVFVRACPAVNCKGFLGTDWKCGICEQSTCKECHELSADDHTCDPNNIETARLLNRDSRPCPKCACMIFKIDGCDQMWCTQCHTAFSWRHGTIVTSIIHNPHYYDYLRTSGNIPRNPMDVPCGGLPEWGVIRKFGISHEIYRLPIHGEHVLGPSYQYREFDPHHNRELRIKYMMNDISEEKFKILIQRDEKCRQKNGDVSNILEMFSTVMTDLFQKLVSEGNSETFMIEFEQLKLYVNSSMSNVSSNYSNCRVPRIIDMHWDM
jgi:hypothetical protein